MATASTGILFNAQAINRTGRVFRQITQSALAAGKKIATIGAGFAVGGAAAIAATAKSLGHLSDVAMQAGVSTAEITKMSTAMDVLGIKSSTPEQLAMAFQRMAKTTGETGVAGFEKVIGAISEMGTVEERASAAMSVFGRTGMDFLPLIEAAAQNGTAALHDVIAAMPGVSDAAAKAGDDLADGMTVLIAGITDLWKNFVGEIVAWFGGNFEGGIRAASMNAVAYIEYFVKLSRRVMTAWANGLQSIWQGLGGTWERVVQSWGEYMLEYFKGLGGWLSDVINVTWDDIQENGIFGKANENFSRRINRAADKLWEGVDFTPFADVATGDLLNELEAKLVTASKGAAAVTSAAVTMSARQGADETAGQIERAVRATRTDLLTADTYRAATMSIRADYGKGEDKTVRAVNAVKSVNEKIQKATESTAAALSNLEMV